MALVLEYAGRDSDTPSDALTPVLVPILLSYAHLSLCWQITKATLLVVCTHPNPEFLAWTPIAWLPGTAMMLTGSTGAGAVAMFLMSIVAGRMLQQTNQRHRRRPLREWKHVASDWRAWVTAVLWLGWIPVPALLSAAYQFGVWSVKGM